MNKLKVGTKIYFHPCYPQGSRYKPFEGKRGKICYVNGSSYGSDSYDIDIYEEGTGCYSERINNVKAINFTVRVPSSEETRNALVKNLEKVIKDKEKVIADAKNVINLTQRKLQYVEQNPEVQEVNMDDFKTWLIVQSFLTPVAAMADRSTLTSVIKQIITIK